jgi:hypothetical protein
MLAALARFCQTQVKAFPAIDFESEGTGAKWRTKTIS